MLETSVPSHLGLILDGNRRWAAQNGLSVIDGYKHGSEVLRDTAIEFINRGVKYVSAYVFSAENWSRSEKEVGYLMSLITRVVEEYLDQFQKEGIKVIVLGRREGLRSKVIKAIEKAEKTTLGNAKGVLALCLNYGGQDEVVDSVNKAIELSTTSPLTKDDINKHLYHSEVPQLDMIIRTSGEQRLSGFMTWRAQYAELYFIEKFWPDFSNKDINDALKWFSKRRRRFGT